MRIVALYLIYYFLKTVSCQSLIFQDSSATTNSIFNTVPAIVTPGLIKKNYYLKLFRIIFILGSTCVCVTSGFCNRAGGSILVPTDGSGLIDIRILNVKKYFFKFSM
jgi:hypothetical protein